MVQRRVIEKENLTKAAQECVECLTNSIEAWKESKTLNINLVSISEGWADPRNENDGMYASSIKVTYEIDGIHYAVSHYESYSEVDLRKNPLDGGILAEILLSMIYERHIDYED